MTTADAAVRRPVPIGAGFASVAEPAATLTGTGALARFILRRDRIRLPVWIVGIVLLALISAASVKALYPTQADLDKAAASAENNAAATAQNGPPYALDTLGGQTVYQSGTFGWVVVALMGMFLVGRHTRADEETGRTELVRATVVGRNAPVTAVLLVATAAMALLAALLALTLVGQGLGVTGSVAFGAAMGAFGLAFACITAVAMQVTEHARTGYGITGAVLGGSYVLRAVGDIGDGRLSWLSPMGWAQQTRPFAGERWWTLLLLLAASAVCVGVTYALVAHRDLGAGLVPPRPGPPTAAGWLTRPSGLALRLQRGGLVAWAVGLAAIGVAYGSIANDVGDLIGDNSRLNDVIAQAGGNLTDAYLATALAMISLISGGFAIAAVLRLRSEETSGRAEPVLATAVARPRWAWSHLAVALGGTVAVLVAGGLGTGLPYGIAIGNLGKGLALVGAAVAYVPAVWVLVGLAFALFGLAPRAVTAAWAALVVCFVIGVLGELLKLPGWVMDVSPFHHVPQMPAQGFALAPLVVLSAVAAALVAAGMVGFRRRDAGF